jgi:hypothetical protein
VENTGRYRLVTPKNWTPEIVRQVELVDNKMSCEVELWLYSILGGNVTKFSIDCTQAYSVAERDFFKGPQGIFLKSLAIRIMMFLYDMEVLKMELKN